MMGRKGGRPAMPLEVMLRIYGLQQWYALSDPLAEESLYDSDAMQRFAGLELGEDRIPDETTILNFRHLLERHDLTAASGTSCCMATRHELTANLGDGIIFRWRIMDVIHASNISRKGKIRHDRDYSYTPHTARGILRSAHICSAQRRSGAADPGHRGGGCQLYGLPCSRTA